jgi:CBS domain-containing protein
MKNIHQNLSALARRILLKDIMHTPPIILHVDDEFSMVEKTLREHRIKHLPIVDDDKKIVGIITLSDLYRTCAPRKNVEDGTFFYTEEQLDSFILSVIMSKDPRCLKEENNLYDAMKSMVHGGYGCIPITDERGRIKGVITQTDIVRVVTNLFSE